MKHVGFGGTPVAKLQSATHPNCNPNSIVRGLNQSIMIIRVQTNIGIWRVDDLDAATATAEDVLSGIAKTRPHVVYEKPLSKDPRCEQVLDATQSLSSQGLGHGSMIHCRVDASTCAENTVDGEARTFLAARANRGKSQQGDEGVGGQEQKKMEAVSLLDSDDEVEYVATTNAARKSLPKNDNKSAHPFIPFRLLETTTSRSIPSNDPKNKYVCTLREMLGIGGSGRTKKYDWLFVFNFLIDFSYLMEQVPELLQFRRVVVFYGQENPLDPMIQNQWRQMLPTGNTVEFKFLCPKNPPNSPSNPFPIKFPYGCHHTKMFLMGYLENGQSMCRVVVHTANLTQSDVEYMTQGKKRKVFDLCVFSCDWKVCGMHYLALEVLMNPRAPFTGAYCQNFPLKQDKSKVVKNPYKVQNPYKRKREDEPKKGNAKVSGWPYDEDDVPFEEDLVTYLESYHYLARQSWCAPADSTSSNRLSNRPMSWLQLIRQYDYSKACVVLIPSFPGRHKDDAYNNVGYLKLRKAIVENVCPHLEGKKQSAAKKPILCQFSSIGSLNEKWLSNFVSATDSSTTSSTDPIATATAKKSKSKKSNENEPELSSRVGIIWPTVEEVRTSVGGYSLGGVSIRRNLRSWKFSTL